MTVDGISIESSTYDVMTRLGSPNRMSLRKWNYQVDEEQYLYLYKKEKALWDVYFRVRRIKILSRITLDNERSYYV